MEKFSTLVTRGVALEADNIDTDQIMPKQFLRGIDKAGLDKGLFYNLKHNADGSLNAQCVLNSEPAKGAGLLLSGPNFGCGSSREHAVWGLMQGGFRVVAAPSFGEIFYSNCFNNGLLVCKVSMTEMSKLFAVVRENPYAEFVVNLQACSIVVDDFTVTFEIAARHRRMLIQGLDMVDTTLSEMEEIKAFRARHEARFPWMVGLPAKAKQVLVQKGESVELS